MSFERILILRANDILVSKCFYLNADKMVYNRGGPTDLQTICGHELLRV